MSLIEDALVGKVRNDAAVVASIGDRIRPELPTDADQFPCIVFLKEDDETRMVMSGPVRLRHAVFTFECWAKAYEDAKDLKARVKTLLNGFAGNVRGVNIRLAKLNDGTDLLEAAVGKEKQRRFGATVSLDVHYRG